MFLHIQCKKTENHNKNVFNCPVSHLFNLLLQSEGKMVTEAMYINKSLSFLEQVVIALADKRREHIPFRQSKLTHYLKDSIGGNCNTVLIANVWGERAQLEETVSYARLLYSIVYVCKAGKKDLFSVPTQLVSCMYIN